MCANSCIQRRKRQNRRHQSVWISDGKPLREGGMKGTLCVYADPPGSEDTLYGSPSARVRSARDMYIDPMMDLYFKVHLFSSTLVRVARSMLARLFHFTLDASLRGIAWRVSCRVRTIGDSRLKRTIIPHANERGVYSRRYTGCITHTHTHTHGCLTVSE